MTAEPVTNTSSHPDPDPAVRQEAGSHPAGTGSTLQVRCEDDPGDLPPDLLDRHPFLARLPVQMDVIVPIPSFRVQNLLTLEKDQVLESHWSHAEDVPVWCGGVQLLWTEFEVVDQKLAVRVTRVG